MADQALNATFFAFRKRERGGVLLRATLAYALIAFVLGGVFAALNWQGFVDYINWAVTLGERAENADPNNPFGALMPPASVMALGPMYFLFMLLFYILFAAYEAACLRWMIHGETGGLMGLSLNADTWRVYFGYWLWFFLGVAIYIVIFTVMFATIAGAVMSAQGEPNAAMSPALGVVPLVLILVLLLAWLYLAVRLAPAAATSVASRRFAFFDAWKVTRGRFWPMLGSFALLFVMFFVGVMILSAVGSAFMVGGLMAQMQNGAEPQTPEEAFAPFASPSVWVPLALIYAGMIIGSFVFYLALFGINARAAALALEEGRIAKAS